MNRSASIEIAPPAESKTGRVLCLSTPLPQPSQHQYFDLVQLDHFWLKRRFEVLRKMSGTLLDPRRRFCEVGCGNGLLQRQLEMFANLEVDGVDVSLEALEHSQSERGALFCYNIFERAPDLREKYDMLFLCDVLEHIADDAAFLKAALFHLKPGGHVLINVPARPELYSAYDEAAGHVRRYNRARFLQVLNRAGVELQNYTYWGLPLYPALIARKLIVSRLATGQKYEAGFRPPRPWVNSLMGWAATLEPIPQKLFGISLLALGRKPRV